MLACLILTELRDSIGDSSDHVNNVYIIWTLSLDSEDIDANSDAHNHVISGNELSTETFVYQNQNDRL